MKRFINIFIAIRLMVASCIRHSLVHVKSIKSANKRGQIVNRVSIDERPSIVDSKSRIGDWEGDTVIGKGRKNAFDTKVERKTLYTVVHRMESKHAKITADALITCMTPYKDRVITVTLDNGKEFAHHEGGINIRG